MTKRFQDFCRNRVKLFKAIYDSRAEINKLDNASDNADSSKSFGHLEDAIKCYILVKEL